MKTRSRLVGEVCRLGSAGAATAAWQPAARHAVPAAHEPVAGHSAWLPPRSLGESDRSADGDRAVDSRPGRPGPSRTRAGVGLRYVGVTSTVPDIRGWRMQTYWYVPGLVNRSEKVFDG